MCRTLEKVKELRRFDNCEVAGKWRERPTEWNTLSQAAVARMLGVTTTRVGQWIAEGKLPALKVEGWARPRVLTTVAERFRRDRDRHQKARGSRE